MDGLRWLLLGLGILVVLGVYLYTRRNTARPPVGGAETDRREPTLAGDDDPDVAWEAPEYPEYPVYADGGDSADDADPRYDDGDSDGDAEPPGGDGNEVAVPAESLEASEVVAPARQKIVTLRIIARGGGAFRGDELILNLRGIGMRHGKFGIFHRYDGASEKEAVFSAASLIEPGSFDLANIREQQIPGISLFAVLPGPVDGVEAFDMLMSAARTLAQSLDGELLDESGSTLSIQRERYMREEVVQYQHGHQVA